MAESPSIVTVISTLVLWPPSELSRMVKVVAPCRACARVFIGSTV